MPFWCLSDLFVVPFFFFFSFVAAGSFWGAALGLEAASLAIMSLT